MGRRFVEVSALAVGLMIIVALGVSGCGSLDDCGGGDKIWRTEDRHRECIGVTAGSHAFNDPEDAEDPRERAIIKQINEVQRKIATENTSVAKSGKYVKLALVMPMTVSNAANTGSATPLDQIKYALEGAYTALRRANESAIFGAPHAPKIQLLLANQGSRQNMSDKFVQKVNQTSDEKGGHPLVGIVGLGNSTEETEEIVAKFAHKGLPMVSAITSSDTLTGKSMMWSVSPSNAQYVQALARFLKDMPTLKSAITVRDQNDDPYINTLAEQFKKQLGKYLHGTPELPFTGGTVDNPATDTLFAPVVTNICNAMNDPQNPVDTVLYAGRVADFEPFARALEQRTCVKRPLAVMVGATGFGYSVNYRQVLDDGNVSVFYSSSAAPAKWAKDPGEAPPDYKGFVAAFTGHGFDEADLSDGFAIAYHDAVATAVQATRVAAQGLEVPPTRADVAAQFSQLVQAYKVRGAGGRLCFHSAARGRALNRVIPVRQIGDTIRFPKGYRPYKLECR